MMFPPGQGRDSNPRCPPLTPGQPWDWAMVGGTGCRSLLRFFFSSTHASLTHSPLSAAHAGSKESSEAAGKLSIVLEARLVLAGPASVLLRYFHQHVVNLALQPSPGCEAYPSLL